MRRGYTEEAVKYYNEAIKLGHEGAAWIMGDFYRSGNCDLIPQDGKKAAEMYKMVSEPYGKYALGILYYYGNGVEKDYGKAYKLFSEARNAKKYAVYDADSYLGAMYYWGRGVKQDYEKAAKYLEAQHGDDPDVKFCYDCMLFYGLGGLKKSQEMAVRDLLDVGGRSKDPIIIRSCGEMIYEYARKFDLDQSPRRKEMINLLVNASLWKSIGAGCRLVEFYLTHTQTQGKRQWDEEGQEWVTVSEEVFTLWEDAANTISRLMEDYHDASESDREEVKKLFLTYGGIIKENSEHHYEWMRITLGY